MYIGIRCKYLPNRYYLLGAVTLAALALWELYYTAKTINQFLIKFLSTWVKNCSIILTIN